MARICEFPVFDADNHVAVIKRNVYVMPFHEDSVAKLIGTIGVDHVIFGSHFPHLKGWPIRAAM